MPNLGGCRLSFKLLWNARCAEEKAFVRRLRHAKTSCPVRWQLFEWLMGFQSHDENHGLSGLDTSKRLWIQLKPV